VEFVDGKLGAVKIYAQEFNGKTLYVNGPVDVTYEVSQAELNLDGDLTKEPFDHFPTATDLKNKLKDLNNTKDKEVKFVPTD
jgi:hypothetical protein